MRQLILKSFLTLFSFAIVAPPALAQERQRQLLSEEPCVPKGVTSVAFSPDGRLLLTGGPAWGIRLFDFETGKELRRFQDRPGYPKFAFSPDGRRAISYGFFKTIYLWDVESGREIRSFPGHEGGTSRAYFTPDSRLAVVGNDPGEYVVSTVNPDSGQEAARIEFSESDGIPTFAFTSDLKQLVGACAEQKVCVWDAKSGKRLRYFQTEN